MASSRSSNTPVPASPSRPAAEPPAAGPAVEPGAGIAGDGRLVAARLDAARAAARSGPLTLTVRGVSMAPLLADGERVQVARAAVYWPGDLVAFAAADGRLLIHRLLGYRPWAGGLAAVTRGDACPGPDAPVPLPRLIGRVVGRPDLAPPAARVRALCGFLGLAARRLKRGRGGR